MKALVLAAHGSRREASNEEVIMLSRTVEQDMSNEYAVVQAGFLEQAKPSIPDAIENCVKLGAIEVVVVPYFLSAGRHVFEDVPAELDQARSYHKNISITITAHIGSSPKMQAVIRELAVNVDLPN